MRLSLSLDSIACQRPHAAAGDQVYVVISGKFGTGRVSRVQPESFVSPGGIAAWTIRSGELLSLNATLHEWDVAELESAHVCCAFAARLHGRYADALSVAATVADAFDQPSAFLLPMIGGPAASPGIAQIQDAPLGEVVITALNYGDTIMTTVYYGYEATSRKGSVHEATSARLSLALTGSSAQYTAVLRITGMPGL